MSLNRVYLVAFAIVSLLFVPACAGQSSAVGSFAPPSAGQAGVKERVRLRIKIPAKGSSSVRRRHGHYISPDTAQLALNVQSGCPDNCTETPGFPITLSLTPTSKGCQKAFGATQCQVDFDLLPGSYVGTFTAEDVHGTALSTYRGSLRVNVGVANDYGFALYGVPASIDASWLGGNAVTLEARDADGNAIVGAGSPAFTVASAGGIPVTLYQPDESAPNVFRVKPSGGGTATLNVTAHYDAAASDVCGQSGAHCTSSVSLTFTHQGGSMWLVNFKTYSVAGYNPPFAAAFHTISSTSYPGGIAFDSSGDMFVVLLGCIEEYAPPYTSAPIVTNCNVGVFADGFTGGLALDSHDNLFAAAGSSNVFEIAPPYTGAPIFNIAGGLNYPQGLAFDASDNLYVANLFGGNVTEYEAPFHIYGASLTGLKNPYGVAIDSKGNLLVSENGSDIVKSSPFPSAVTQVIDGLADPGSMAFDASGNLYVTNQNSNRVSEYDASYGLVNAALATDTSTPTFLAFNDTYSIQTSP